MANVDPEAAFPHRDNREVPLLETVFLKWVCSPVAVVEKVVALLTKKKLIVNQACSIDVPEAFEVDGSPGAVLANQHLKLDSAGMGLEGKVSDLGVVLLN